MNSIVKEYSIKKIIGKGTFSVVKLGFDRETGEKVAIKILEKKKILNKSDAERVDREINILKEINHLNLIKIIKIKEDVDKYYMIMEFCENGELFNQIVKKRKLDENESAYYYFQLINGLEYIHSKNIVHRDLKPENLLINKKNILKIIDFGLSNYYKENNFLSTPCGSPCYASPEMIAGKKYDGNLIDVWSSGIILFAMLCGYLPFDGLTNEILFKKILRCKIEYPKFLSNTSIDLLKKILVNEPNNRITISEIKKHPFYLKGREEFKKLHPSIFEKIERNFKHKTILKNFDYGRFLTKTEEDEKTEINDKNDIHNHNRKLNLHSFNLDNFFNRSVLSRKDKSIYHLLNTPEKNNIFQFKRSNPSNDNKYANDNSKEDLTNLRTERDLNSLDKYINNHNERNLTDIARYNLNDSKKNDYSKKENKILKTNMPKLLKYISYSKDDKPRTKDNYSFRKLNKTPNKLFFNFRNNFNFLDFENSHFLYNYYRKKNDRTYCDYNKNGKNIFDTINQNSKTINSIEKEGNQKLFFHNLTPDKKHLIKKFNSVKNNSQDKDKDKNKNNNIKYISKIKSKFNFKEREKQKEKENKYYLIKRKRMTEIINDFNSFRITKTNNMEYKLNNEINDKVQNVSGISSLNNPINKNSFNGLKVKTANKEFLNAQENNKNDIVYDKIFNKNNLSNKKESSNHFKFNREFILNTINYDENKYLLNDTRNNNFNFNNKENDKNYGNVNNPTITINNTNYNLNLNESKNYFSTINNDLSRKKERIYICKNTKKIVSKMNTRDGYLKRRTTSKKGKLFNKIYENNKSNNKDKKTSSGKHYLTQINSTINNGRNRRKSRKKTLNLTNIKNLDKIKTLLLINRKALFKNSRERKNNNSKLLVEKKTIDSFRKNDKIDISDKIEENEKSNNITIKRNILNKNSFKNSKKFDLGFDLLYKLRLKKNELIKSKNKNMNSEKNRQKIFSPSLTLENNNNININNYNNDDTYFNKSLLSEYFSMNKSNKLRKNSDKKHFVFNSLINDFVNYSNRKNIDNNLMIPIQN